MPAQLPFPSKHDLPSFSVLSEEYSFSFQFSVGSLVILMANFRWQELVKFVFEHFKEATPKLQVGLFLWKEKFKEVQGSTTSSHLIKFS